MLPKAHRYKVWVLFNTPADGQFDGGGDDDHDDQSVVISSAQLKCELGRDLQFRKMEVSGGKMALPTV